MKALFGLLLCVPLLLWGGLRIERAIVFDINCGGHLKRAADANTVQLARTELAAALTYAERSGYTEGYTSVLWRTPDEDVGFWYRNLTASLRELDAIPANAGPLERSNMLMKLRETLLDQGKESVRVTAPEGISVFPANGGYAFVGYVALIFALGGCFLIVVWLIDEM